ncbi:transcription factor TFIIK complex ubiquitin-protein ligase E3 subunit, Pmh1 [Schizosaccharomyces osmophilus]|uniref:RNA polymerase II transcription factor B subunit 3 n=1 Tax=Schizosaccharomyces osmophilus TaxID=2545709 RepID=A0AAF0AV32_9SCHI|nr:transcription factor TFIIK complex ubiquitin-protein ligase E3 subunit, Pmh1 [Schizosaccharomyces osmophilus]WBW72182.1 transcription factor TFIIK complex ubiquitin-protein ligase E3 subunit, Pmh1 [Schizosaccharomyces osmophilus]
MEDSDVPKKNDEKCPLCRADRYLNPNMKLLINPECYHKMCESCVDRIFTTGPAACPTPGCGKILRKAKFREQTFEDAQIEREIDVRRRIAKIFNKGQQDFESLQEYNDYLEEVENLTFNLIYQVDVEETEKRVQQYEKQNRESIALNSARAAAESRLFAQNEILLKKQKQEARDAVVREHELERERREQVEQQIIHDLATSGKDPNKIVKLTETLKKHREKKDSPQLDPSRSSALYPGLQNLALRRLKEEQMPFSPLAGERNTSKYYDYSIENYNDPFMDKITKEPNRSIGFRVEDCHLRCLYEAFSGLDFDLTEINPPTKTDSNVQAATMSTS